MSAPLRAVGASSAIRPFALLSMFWAAACGPEGSGLTADAAVDSVADGAAETENPPAPEENPAPDEAPAPEETPAPGEVPAPEETPAPDEVPAPEEPPAPEAAPPGTEDEQVTRLDAPCERAPESATRCERLEVTCAGVAPRIVELVTYAPAGPSRGTILFGSGGEGTGLYNFRGRDALNDAGFTVVERRWPGGWFTGATAGPGEAACGLAAVLRHLRATLPPEQHLCATGNSGGSVELTYALTWQNAAASLDLALPTSGPFHRLDLACQGEMDPEWTAECSALKAELCPECASRQCQVVGPRRLVDVSYGDAPRCSMPAGADDLARLRADSPIFGPDVDTLDGFPLRVLIGSLDGGAYLPLAGAFVASAEAFGAEIVFDVVDGADHEMDASPKGVEAITEALLEGCASRR